MVDNRASVYAALVSLGYTVDYYYPSTFADVDENGTFQFPRMSYYDSGHTPDDYADNVPHIDETEITVDVWEKANPQTGELVEIHAQADKVMADAGFTRVVYIPQSQMNDKEILYHITMKFKKLESED